MPDRSAFFSPPPDWSGAVLASDGMRLSAREPAFAWQLSGHLGEFLARHGLEPALGPRDRCEGERYVLRLAPDSVLLLSERALEIDTGWSAPGIAASELADGIVCIDIEGAGAGELMALGSEYPFASPPEVAGESARMLFAGLRVAVVRRPQGWRLHIERPWAAALWHWLERVINEDRA